MDSFSELLERVNQCGYIKASHVRVTKAGVDCAEGELDVGPDSLNPHGIIHGGCLSTLADTVGGVAASTRGGVCVTLNNTMNYLAPALGPVIRCTARPQRVGRTVGVFDLTLTDGRGQVVATGTYTFYLKRDK